MRCLGEAVSGAVIRKGVPLHQSVSAESIRNGELHLDDVPAHYRTLMADGLVFTQVRAGSIPVGSTNSMALSSSWYRTPVSQAGNPSSILGGAASSCSRSWNGQGVLSLR